jgi:hypothetical protein
VAGQGARRKGDVAELGEDEEAVEKHVLPVLTYAATLSFST